MTYLLGRVAAGNLSLMDADTHNIRHLVSGPAMPDHTGFTRLPICNMQDSLALRPAQGKRPGADDQSAPGLFRKEKRGKKMKVEWKVDSAKSVSLLLYVHNNRICVKNQ